MKNESIRIRISFIFICVFSLISLYSEFVFIYLCSVFIHELAHLAMLSQMNIQIESINIKLSEIKISREYMSDKILEAVVSAAGPLANLVVSITAFALGNSEIGGVNLILFLVNLLPVYPFDGSTVWFALNIKWRRAITVIVSLILLCLGAAVAAVTKNNFSLLILGILIMVNSLEFSACKKS